MRKSESCYPCQFGAIVQLVRTPACHAGGRGFNPHSSRHRSLVQLRRTTDSKSGMLFRYGGLIPSTPAIFSNARIAQWQCSCFVSSWLWVQLLLLAPLNRALLRLRHIVCKLIMEPKDYYENFKNKLQDTIDSVEDKELHRDVSLEDVTDTWGNITYDLV